MYCTYNTDMKRNRITMQFSSPTPAPTTQTKNVPTQPISFQMTTPTGSRFRMYTAMNDILYTPLAGGCSSCGNKK